MFALTTLGLLALSVLFVLYCAQRAATQSRRDGVTQADNTLTRTAHGPLNIVWWIGAGLAVTPIVIAWFR